ncbi:MAG TPA: hypothetical protein VMV94_13160 [Phycisphaerae bacterium]|nr:hypothetical protein [Phycisphaerae bacterium]
MSRAKSSVVVLLLIGAGAFASAGAQCAALFPPASLAGTYAGTTDFSGTITPTQPAGQPFTITYASASQIVIDSNDLPAALDLPVILDNGTSGRQIGLDIFTVGATKTYTQSSNLTINGATVAMSVTLNVTVREAQVTDTTFHFVYDYTGTTTFSGGLLGGTTLNFTGTATFDGSLSGSTLTYNVTISQDTTSTTGSVTLVFHADLTSNSTLTRL